MDERRKQAYRYLLYRAMVDIRPIGGMPLGFLNPFRWKRTTAQVHRAGVIANWLHNLAFYSAVDFKGFNEEWFWDTLQRFQNRYPDFYLDDYQKVFERELTGKGHLRGS